jgi:hypothetical protein
MKADMIVQLQPPVGIGADDVQLIVGAKQE